MNPRKAMFIVALPSLVAVMPLEAHDPSEHMVGSEMPDCAAMDHSNTAKMDMNDPVVQAMMKKCMGSSQAGHHTADESDGAIAGETANKEEHLHVEEPERAH